MRELSQYSSVGAWYEDAKRHGWRVPLELCRGVSQLMKRANLSFPDAFAKLKSEGKITLVGKTYIFDLSALE